MANARADGKARLIAAIRYTSFPAVLYRDRETCAANGGFSDSYHVPAFAPAPFLCEVFN
ncbi:hypothetical protein SAMN05720354_10750 [Nitrosospira sp. Nsp1]|nr:hypothetical protein SAMN05720354_10750 [Nitrosospira sp. Nsp1]